MSDLIFPSNEAWQGKLGIFKSLLMDRTECPESFAFAAALTAISMVIQKNVYINYGRKIRLNIFSLVLGKANDSHKGLAISLVRELLKNVEIKLSELQIPLNLALVGTIDSGEGFINMLPESGNALILMDEIATIFKKGKGETSTIQTTLINAYDGVELGRSTVKEKKKIPEHFINLLAGSNPGLINDNLRTIDAESGLLGRFIVLYGERKNLVSWPQPMDEIKFARAVDYLIGIYLNAQGIPDLEIKPTPEAIMYWEQAYRVMQEDISTNDDCIQQELWKRLHLNIIKISGLFAMAEGRFEITRSDVERASAIGLYIAKSLEKLRECVGKTRQRGIEDKIIRYLEKVGGRAKMRDIQQHVRGKDIDARKFSNSISSLLYTEIIAIDGETEEFYIPGSTFNNSTEEQAVGK